MMKRKIRLGALLAVSVMMLALLIGGLYGAFDDTETSIENTFSAGSLNLVTAINGANAVDNTTTVITDRGDGLNDNVTFGVVKPLDTGYIIWTLSNTGTIDGTLSVTAANSAGHENGQNEPEATVDSTPADPGELVDALTCDVTIDGVASGPMAFSLVAGYLLANVDNTIGAGDSIVIRLDWSAAGGSFDNTVQTDTAQLDVTWFLTQ